VGVKRGEEHLQSGSCNVKSKGRKGKGKRSFETLTYKKNRNPQVNYGTGKKKSWYTKKEKTTGGGLATSKKGTLGGGRGGLQGPLTHVRPKQTQQQSHCGVRNGKKTRVTFAPALGEAKSALTGTINT